MKSEGDLLDAQFGWIAQSGPGWMAISDSLNQLMCVVDVDSRVVHANRIVQRWGLLDVSECASGMLLHDLLHAGCVDPSCYLGDIIGEIGRARHHGTIVTHDVEDVRLNRHLEVVVLPVKVMARLGDDPAQDAAVVRFIDRTAMKHTERWLRESIDDLNAELKKRTTAQEQSNTQFLRADAALRRTESELRLLAAALMTMQETERKRIATDLHDSIGQSLSALRFGISVALDGVRSGHVDMAVDMLGKLSEQVRSAISEVRRIAMDLRPATLDDLGIVGTLSWFFREFRSIHPNLLLLTNVTLDEIDVAPALRTTIFRVVQEAVNNVVKHARAKELRVDLGRDGAEIILQVEDDGHGFNVGDPRSNTSGSGMGLNGMRDRVEYSGGTFRCDSEPDRGTRIVAKWPLRAT
jgi:signal transduction histidine kinase